MKSGRHDRKPVTEADKFLSSLRERIEDIPMIADFLLEEILKGMGRREIRGFSAGVIERLCSYSWPGNVRELRNVIERAAILCKDGDITPEHLLLPRTGDRAEGSLALTAVEKTHIKKVLDMTGGNRSRSAQILGIARSTLNEKIKIYQLQ